MSARVVVIGGGINGLVTATTLARAGRRVTLVESRPVLGGLAAREEFAEGFFVPGLLNDSAAVRPALLDDLELDRFGLSWREPAEIYAPRRAGGGLWLRGTRLDGEVADGDGERYAAHRGFIDRVGRALNYLNERMPPDPKGRLWPLLMTARRVRGLGAKDMVELLRVGPMCVADWMRDSFSDERLRAAVALPALEGAFMGPWSAGTAANLLIRECASGREVKGGPAALTAALAAAAKAHGVDIRQGSRVVRIRLDNRSTVKGVAIAGRDGKGAGDTESGDTEFIDADIVAASCDPKQTFLGLIGSDKLSVRLATDISRIRTRGTTAKLHLALSGPLLAEDGEEVEAARIGETLDDLERAFDAVKYGGFSESPVLDVRVPSLSDPSLCPDGHHVVSVVAHFAAHDLRGGWTDERREALGRAIIDTLAVHFPDLADTIVAREVLGPADIGRRYGLTGGHIHHGEHAPDQLLFMRPTMQCANYRTPVRGLFLCGSGCHPGGSIKGAAGALAARAILRATE